MHVAYPQHCGEHLPRVYFGLLACDPVAPLLPQRHICISMTVNPRRISVAPMMDWTN